MVKYRIDVRLCPQGHFHAFVLDEKDHVRYRSDGFDNQEDAREDAIAWFRWSQDVVQGKADSIYYIVAVPHDWVGSPLIHSYPYVGLRVKIGVSKHPDKRVRELQTGTSDTLILHALEPGDRELERRRHLEFAAHRKIGEWFVCSQALTNHILRTWAKYRILPPEHQQNVLVLLNRIKLFRALRNLWPDGPDMVNPPLDVPWHGNVFLDLL
jgi:Meiotically Up-regulated Gene 113 (MUG113) protein